MKCNEAERWISVKIDGEDVPAGKAVELEGHLAACTACREALAAETRRAGILDRALSAGAAGDPALAAAVAAAARTGAGEARPGREGAVVRMRFLRMAAAAAVIIGIGLFLLRPDGHPHAGKTGPSGGGPVPISSASYRPSVFEEESVDPRLELNRAGRPVERVIVNQHYIYWFPALRPQDLQITLDVEKSATRDIRPVDLKYY
jgi:hypothetical protein